MTKMLLALLRKAALPLSQTRFGCKAIAGWSNPDAAELPGAAAAVIAAGAAKAVMQ